MKIVTGTGRSGTSMIAGLLNAIGLDFGPQHELLAADETNESGFFENKRIVATNIRILLGDISDPLATISTKRNSFLSSLTTGFRKWKYLYPQSTKTLINSSNRLQQEIISLGNEFSGRAVKDPRFSLTLGCWSQHGLAQRVLYCYRDPLEVADSMQRAYRLPRWTTFMVWRQRVARLLEQLGGIDVVFTDYNAFFNEDTLLEELKRLYSFAGKEFDADESIRLYGSLVNPAMKHFARPHNSQLPAKVKKTYDLLHSLHHSYAIPKPFNFPV